MRATFWRGGAFSLEAARSSSISESLNLCSVNLYGCQSANQSGSHWLKPRLFSSAIGPFFSGFTTRAKNGFFADADLHSRTHQSVYNSHGTYQNVRHDHVRFPHQGHRPHPGAQDRRPPRRRQGAGQHVAGKSIPHRHLYIFREPRNEPACRTNTAPRLDPLPDLATPFRSNRTPEPTPAPPTRTRPPLSATTTSCP